MLGIKYAASLLSQADQLPLNVSEVPCLDDARV